jgi:hypothetical protein
MATQKSSKFLSIGLPQALGLLSKTVLGILIVFVLAAAFPVQVRDPLWYLKIAQIAVDYSFALLFAIALALLGSHFSAEQIRMNAQLFGQDQEVRSQFSFLQRLLSAALALYVVLIPIQMLAFGLQWRLSNQRVKLALRSAESNVDTLRKRIRDVRSEVELRRLFGIASLEAPSLNTAPSVLAAERTKALEAVEGQFSNLRTRLNGERRKLLTSLIISTIKGIFGALILAFFLSKLRSWRPNR